MAVRPAPVAAAATVRFPTFEGLRALCAIAVLAYHAGTFTGLAWGPGVSRSELGPWVQHLNVGVSVFFVLSGFLLFRPFVTAHLADRPRPVTGSYLLRRLVRIFPAYWLALFVATRELGLNLGDWWGHVRYYGLIQVYSGDTVLGGLPQAWSLNTELSFYLFLPLWAALLGRVGGSADRRLRAHYLGCAVLWLVGVGFRARLRAGDHAVGYAWLPANCDLFALGMALAVASAGVTVTGRAVPALARTVADLPGAAWVAAACCYAGAVTLGYPVGFDPPTVTQEVLRQILFGAIATLVVAPGVFGAQDRGAVRRVLRSRPLWAIGVVSYGVYLWHLTVIPRVLGPGPLPRPRIVADLHLPWPAGLTGPTAWWTVTAWSLAVTVAVAGVSWFLVERPLLRFVRSRRGHPRAPVVGGSGPGSG